MKPVVKEILEWIICIVVAVGLALIVRFYIGTPTIVEQTSMFPTLVEGQRLWLNRWNRTIKKMPERGDIITFEAPSLTYPKDDEVNLENAIAVYNYNLTGGWEKFKYYVLEFTKTSYIKRIIALPGEHVEIKEGAVYINGEKLKEEYLQPGVVTDMKQGGTYNGLYTDFIVPENSVFALGDNRNSSTDCRSFGCIPLEKIESKVAFRFYPFDLFGKVD